MDTPPQARQPPAWRRSIHLWLPLFTSVWQLFHGLNFIQTLDPAITKYWLAASAIPTYLLGSVFYSPDRQAPSSEGRTRFTRKHWACRVGVLFTYGRIFNSPFNIWSFALDVILTPVADMVIGDKPRRSDFFVAALWCAASGLVWGFSSFNVVLFNIMGTVDRILWRTAYLALVDDIIGVLGHPNVATLKGKVIVILVQAGLINFFVVYTLMRLDGALSQERREEFAANLQDQNETSNIPHQFRQ